MVAEFKLPRPQIIPPLDVEFRPAALANREFNDAVAAAGKGVPLIFGLERSDGSFSRYDTRVFPEEDPRAAANLIYAERIFKFLLWQQGGWRIYIGGPRSIGEYIKDCYSATGVRAFDYRFMGEDVYEKRFTVIPCEPSEVPAKQECGRLLGGHLDGCRIGFDLGASDYKVAAVVAGKTVFSEEVVWEPGRRNDPDYYYCAIITALRKAAAKMARVDAVGGSAAGIYVDNQVRVASLFRNIPQDRYGTVRNLFLRIRDEMGVPLEIVNDGEVAALAGSMSLQDNGVLGLALGSSEAGGYVTLTGKITGWLNELAFAPIDYSQYAPVDEWSGDSGCGAQYLSQQCVFRLSSAVGIDIPSDITDAEKLNCVQEKLEAGNRGATQIWESIGIYLGYAIAHYALFYELKHVLILGRCTSGRGGELILDGANKVLATEFPQLAEQIRIHLPDEHIRRVGQSIAAASLPGIGRRKADDTCNYAGALHLKNYPRRENEFKIRDL